MNDVRFGCWGVARAPASDVEREWDKTHMRHMRAAGERNFQSEGDRYKENITLSLHYMVSMCKGHRESLVDNHIMGDVLKM